MVNCIYSLFVVAELDGEQTRVLTRDFGEIYSCVRYSVPILFRQSTVFRNVFECCLIFGGVGISIKLSSSASSVYYKNIANDTAINFLSFLMWSYKMRWPCIHGQVSGQFYGTGTYDAPMEVN